MRTVPDPVPAVNRIERMPDLETELFPPTRPSSGFKKHCGSWILAT